MWIREKLFVFMILTYYVSFFYVYTINEANITNSQSCRRQWVRCSIKAVKSSLVTSCPLGLLEQSERNNNTLKRALISESILLKRVERMRVSTSSYCFLVMLQNIKFNQVNIDSLMCSVQHTTGNLNKFPVVRYTETHNAITHSSFDLSKDSISSCYGPYLSLSQELTLS